MQDDMMKALKGRLMPVEGKEKDAKMEVLKELIKQMHMIMADQGQGDMSPEDMPMDDGQQVMVAAKNPEDMKQGLGMAKEMIADDMNPDMDVHMDDEDEEDTKF